MSLFFTAPPIYNTGGFNTYYSGFGHSFNPTGVAPDTLESGSSDLTIGSEYYYSRSLYFDFKKELTLNRAAYSFHRFDYEQQLTLNHAAYNFHRFDFEQELTLSHAVSKSGKVHLREVPAINFASNSADKFGNFKSGILFYSICTWNIELMNKFSWCTSLFGYFLLL